MKIVIDIPDDVYKFITTECKDVVISEIKAPIEYIIRCIIDSTPLPKGHGRLIDVDKTLATAWANFYVHEDEWEKKDPNYVPLGRFYGQNGFECCQQTIVNAPTIIEADKSDVD